MGRAHLAVLAVLLPWVVWGHHLAPLLRPGEAGPWADPRVWALTVVYGGLAAIGWRWAGARALADGLTVGWMVMIGHVAYLFGGWIGLGALAVLIVNLGICSWAFARGRRSTGGRGWAVAGAVLAGPFAVIAPLSVRWLWVEAQREWPVDLLSMVRPMRLLMGLGTAVVPVLLVTTWLALYCWGRAAPPAEEP